MALSPLEGRTSLWGRDNFIAGVAMKSDASLPGIEKRMEVGFTGVAQGFAHQIGFALPPGLIEIAAYQFEAQIYKISIERVGFAIVADLADLAGQELAPDLAPVPAELARKPQQLRDLVERRRGARLIARQYIHQVGVARVVAAEVIVPFEVAVVVAGVPVARRRHTVFEGAIMQHREIEAAAIPAHQHRRVFLDAIEKTPDQLRLRGIRLAQRPRAPAVAGAQYRRDRRHATQAMAQKIGFAGLFATLGEHDLRHVLVAQPVQSVQFAAGLDVRNSFDVECQYVHIIF